MVTVQTRYSESRLQGPLYAPATVEPYKQNDLTSDHIYKQLFYFVPTQTDLKPSWSYNCRFYKWDALYIDVASSKKKYHILYYCHIPTQSCIKVGRAFLSPILGPFATGAMLREIPSDPIPPCIPPIWVRGRKMRGSSRKSYSIRDPGGNQLFGHHVVVYLYMLYNQTHLQSLSLPPFTR